MSSRLTLDGDGVYWRARQAAREAAERQIYVDPADGHRATLREHLARLRATELPEEECVARLKACRTVE